MPVVTADFHTHLLEKKVKTKDYWKAVKARKLDVVATTEHADKKPEKAYRLLLEKKPKIVVLIPGVELNTKIGHVLAFGKNASIYKEKELLKKNVSIKKVIEIANDKGLVLSISHPWGFSYDSAAYVTSEKKIANLVQKENIGVEVFNGMFGNVSSFFYKSNWVKRPMNLFDFLEKSKIGKRTRLNKIGKRGKEKLDKKGKEILERCIKPMELGEKASFVTAGSDAHSPQRIGTGIMKLMVKGRVSPGSVLKALQDKKNVRWAGPYVRKTSKGMKVKEAGIKRKEVFSSIKYAAKKAIVKKVSSRIRRKKN